MLATFDHSFHAICREHFHGLRDLYRFIVTSCNKTDVGQFPRPPHKRAAAAQNKPQGELFRKVTPFANGYREPSAPPRAARRATA
jgi:hypothetical protein